MSTNYTIYLLKKAVTTLDAAFDVEKQTTRYNLASTLSFTGALFVGDQQQSQPKWVGLLNPFLQTPVARALSANISAVLLIEYEQRIFAITFGYGKGLLAASSWVRDFGLKVTINRVDPKKLRSVDTKTYEDMVISTRRQASRSATANSFEFDVARDLVRGVTGAPKDTTFFKRLTGSDAVTVSTELKFDDLGDLLDELLEAYKDTAYKANFGWIDNVKEVDPTAQQKLDTILVAAVRSGNLNGMHLAPADIIAWEDIAGFNFTTGKKSILYPELDLQDYLSVLGTKVTSLDLDQLQRHKVQVRFEGSVEFHDQWAVYDCIVWEADMAGRKFVLFDGRWFEIDQDYAARVSKFVQGISKNSVALPTAKLGQEEGDYNEGVVVTYPDQFALLDRQTVYPAGAASPIEFCDLLSKDRHLIHVKKRSGSATLSHLFAQGSVSADAFLSDPEVRKEIRSKLSPKGKSSYRSLIPADRPTPIDFEVVYAVLAKNCTPWPPALPFFSAVNVMHHATRIQNLGFKVSLQHVKQT